MFRLSLLSINQLDLAGYTMTFRRGKCSIFTVKAPTIIANHTGNLYILLSRYALTSETGTATPMTVQLRLHQLILQLPNERRERRTYRRQLNLLLIPQLQ